MVYACEVVRTHRRADWIFPQVVSHIVMPLRLFDIVDRQLDPVVVGVTIVQRHRQTVMDRDPRGNSGRLETLIRGDPIAKRRIEECEVIEAGTAFRLLDQPWNGG